MRTGPPVEGPLGVGVGPTSSEGFGNTSVMYSADLPAPPGVQAWSGWPVGWDVPLWGNQPGWLTARCSTVGTCVDTIGRTASTFPPRVTRKTDLLDPQPLWTDNPEPNLYANFDEWVKGAINSLLIRGNCFIAATGRNAESYPNRWVTLNPDYMEVEIVGGQLVYRFAGDRIPSEDVLHIKYQQIPGSLVGLGPLDWTLRNIMSADALAQYGTNLAQRGGIPWGVLTAPGNVSSTQSAGIRDQWNAAAPTRNGAPAILSGGMTLQTLSFSPENMALLSLREFDEQRIGAAFGVPPSFLNLPEPSGLTYTTAQMIQSHFYYDTLRPMMKNIGDALSLWALPRGTNVTFDASEYLAPDLPAHVSALVQAAAIIPEAADELRRVLGMPGASMKPAVPPAPAMPAPAPMGVT